MATSTQDTTGSIAGGEASQGTQAQTAAQLLQALAQSQADMKRAYDQVLSSLSENLQKTQSISEDFAKKQDTNVDETIAGGSAVLNSNQIAVSNVVNQNAAHWANVAAARSQTHFDNLQAIVTMMLSGSAFNQNACQGFVAWNGHHQCGVTANAK